MEFFFQFVIGVFELEIRRQRTRLSIRLQQTYGKGNIARIVLEALPISS